MSALFCCIVEKTTNKVLPKPRLGSTRLARPHCSVQSSAPDMTGRMFHRTTEAISRRPWKAKALCFQTYQNEHKEGRARGALEVQHCTSLGNASLFTKFSYTIFVPINPPPLPTSKMTDFPLDFLLDGPQTELRTLSQNCEQTLQKL